MYSTMFPSNQITCQTPIVWMDHTIDMTLPKGKAEAMSVPNMPGTLGIEPFVWICFSILTNLMIHPKNHILDFEDKDTRLKIRILPKLLIYSYHWNIYSHAKRLNLASQKKRKQSYVQHHILTVLSYMSLKNYSGTTVWLLLYWSLIRSLFKIQNEGQASRGGPVRAVELREMLKLPALPRFEARHTWSSF